MDRQSFTKIYLKRKKKQTGKVEYNEKSYNEKLLEVNGIKKNWFACLKLKILFAYFKN